MRPTVSPFIRTKSRIPDREALVIEILTFLGEDSKRMDRFLTLSGLGMGDLRAVAATPAFAESLLDHLCSDEPLLVAFAETQAYDPASIERVRQSLAPPPFEE